MFGFALLLTLASPLTASDVSSLPADVTEFIAGRELCEHFRGEPTQGNHPDDIARREFIGDNIELYCSGTDRRLAALKRLHRGSAAVAARLQTLDTGIEVPCGEP